MLNKVHAELTISISDLKKNAMQAISSEPVAVLNHNKVIYYCVPPDVFEGMLTLIDDFELIKRAQEKSEQEPIKVNIDEL